MSLVSLSQVVDRCDMNKMTAANLAVVFGPNLAWPNDTTMSLTYNGPINAFTEYLFSPHTCMMSSRVKSEII